MHTKNTKTFAELKAEYSLPKTTEMHKKELILFMQENLKQRCGKENGTIKCLDGNKYSIVYDNVGELYAIEAALNDADRRKQFDKMSEKIVKKHYHRIKINPAIHITENEVDI